MDENIMLGFEVIHHCGDDRLDQGILQERLAHLIGFDVHFPLGESCQLTHGVYRAVEIVVALQVAFAAPIM